MELLEQYYIPVVAAICIAIHYMITKALTTRKAKKYIPLIMGVVGIGINAWMHMGFSPDIVLGGLASGLASTGVFEMLKGMKKEEKSKESKDKVVFTAEPGSRVNMNDSVIVQCAAGETPQPSPASKNATAKPVAEGVKEEKAGKSETKEKAKPAEKEGAGKKGKKSSKSAAHKKEEESSKQAKPNESVKTESSKKASASKDKDMNAQEGKSAVTPREAGEEQE